MKTDWKLYVERRTTLYYNSVYIMAYGPLSEKKIGFGFKKQLNFMDGDAYTSYKSQKELDSADCFFLKLVKDKKREARLYKKCLEMQKQENSLIARFKTILASEIRRDYESIIKCLEEIFFYLTVIPWQVLLAAETGNLTRDIVKRYSLLRKTSRRSLTPLVFEKIWEAGGKNNMQFARYTPSEFGVYLRTKRKPAQIEKRKGKFAFYLKNRKIAFNYSPSFATRQGISTQNYSHIKMVQGKTAFKGKMKGRVCLIYNPAGLHKFRKGDIIVSINAPPTITTAIEKCSAIVTDEGGLLCHAAIVSRELKIPCVIGTSIATKVFKDGDIVEVDATKGIVRRIK